MKMNTQTQELKHEAFQENCESSSNLQLHNIVSDVVWAARTAIDQVYYNERLVIALAEMTRRGMDVSDFNTNNEVF